VRLAGTEMLLSNLLKPWFFYCSPAVLEIHPFMFKYDNMKQAEITTLCFIMSLAKICQPFIKQDLHCPQQDFCVMKDCCI